MLTMGHLSATFPSSDVPAGGSTYSLLQWNGFGQTQLLTLLSGTIYTRPEYRAAHLQRDSRLSRAETRTTEHPQNESAQLSSISVSRRSRLARPQSLGVSSLLLLRAAKLKSVNGIIRELLEAGHHAFASCQGSVKCLLLTAVLLVREIACVVLLSPAKCQSPALK